MGRQHCGYGWTSLGTTVTGAAEGDGTCAGADGEPEDVAAKAQPEGASFCGGDGCVALAGKRGDFCDVVRGVELRAG